MRRFLRPVAACLALSPTALAQDCADVPLFEVFGAGTSGSAGIPTLASVGFPVLDGVFALELEGGAPLAPAVLLFSTSEGALPLPQFGATVLPGLPFFELPFFLDTAGAARPILALDPVPSSFCGTTLVFQAAVLDVGATGFAAFTPGARARFGGPEAPPLFPLPVYGDGTNDVAVGDLNGDGREDVVQFQLGGGETDAITVLLGLGGGRFAPASTFEVGDSPESMDLGDLDGDGNLDVVVLDGLDDKLSILLGSGDGSFTAVGDIPTSRFPRDLKLADLDGDGVLDIALVAVGNSPSANELNVLLGQGDGTFGPAVVNPILTAVSNLEVADFDLDGELDIAVLGVSGLEVLFGQGGGALSTPTGLFSAPNGLNDLETGDLNGDGLIDLAFINFSNDEVTALLSQGDGTFSSPLSSLSIAQPFRLALGDLDGDSRVDAVVAGLSSNGGQVSRMLGQGDGMFSGPELVGDFSVVRDFAVRDVSQDGRSDLLISGNSLKVLLTGPDGQLIQPLVEPTGAGSILARGDFDGDGIDDAIVADEITDTASFVRGAADGFEPAQLIGPVPNPLRAASADFDGDGSLDFVLGTVDDPQVFLGLGDGTFAAPVALPTTGQTNQAVAVGDLNGDGDPDIVITRPFTTGVTFLGNGDGTFGAGQEFTPGTLAVAISIGDVDQDGNADVATVNEFTDDVSVLLGNGDGTLAAAVTLAVGNSPVDCELADFDGDALLDLAVVNRFDGTVSILPGQVGTTFGPAESTAVGGFPRALAVGDADVDGTLDLVLVRGGEVVVLAGAGDGTFGPPSGFGVFDSPRDLGLDDQDQDGRTDIIVIADDGLSLLLGQDQ